MRHYDKFFHLRFDKIYRFDSILKNLMEPILLELQFEFSKNDHSGQTVLR